MQYPILFPNKFIFIYPTSFSKTSVNQANIFYHNIQRVNTI